MEELTAFADTQSGNIINDLVLNFYCKNPSFLQECRHIESLNKSLPLFDAYYYLLENEGALEYHDGVTLWHLNQQITHDVIDHCLCTLQSTSSDSDATTDLSLGLQCELPTDKDNTRGFQYALEDFITNCSRPGFPHFDILIGMNLERMNIDYDFHTKLCNCCKELSSMHTDFLSRNIAPGDHEYYKAIHGKLDSFISNLSDFEIEQITKIITLFNMKQVKRGVLRTIRIRYINNLIGCINSVSEKDLRNARLSIVAATRNLSKLYFEAQKKRMSLFNSYSDFEAYLVSQTNPLTGTVHPLNFVLPISNDEIKLSLEKMSKHVKIFMKNPVIKARLLELSESVNQDMCYHYSIN